MKYFLFISFLLAIASSIKSQPIPAKEENIPFLVTFGSKADKSWGDDDFCQIFFIVIPKTYSKPFYIRIFDPETSGQNDEQKAAYNTKTKFSIYGGTGCVTNKDATNIDPVGNYKSGNLLAEKTFGSESTYDNKWFTFRPFSPTEGELQPEYGGYVIKIIAQGIEGDDGNLYRYYISTSATENISVEGGNSFTYEYSFRMHDNPNEVSHIYPYIDDKVISIKQSNFDWDNDGRLFFVSVTRKAVEMSKSPDKEWKESEHKILESEKKSSIDIQMHKNKQSPAKNNNVVFYIRNQYGAAMPFYTVPIGGIPKPKSSIIIRPSE